MECVKVNYQNICTSTNETCTALVYVIIKLIKEVMASKICIRMSSLKRFKQIVPFIHLEQ